MKLSEVTVANAIGQAKEDAEDTDIFSDFAVFLEAAKGFILSYTGLTLEQADAKPELTIALFVLINEMHDNRSYTVKEDKINPAVKTILEMHSVSLL